MTETSGAGSKLKMGDVKKGAILDTEFAIRDGVDNAQALFRQGQIFVDSTNSPMVNVSHPILNKVKVEVVDNIESAHFIYHEFSSYPQKFPKKEDGCSQEKSVSIIPVSNEANFIRCKREISEEYPEDDIDHVTLLDRILRLDQPQKYEHLTIVHTPCSGASGTFIHAKGSAKTKHISAEYVKPSKRSRKARKNATDSVEIAMGEDAPGLLQAMIDKGVSPDELKIWDSQTEDSLDDLIGEDNLKELEDIISRIWKKREPLIKLASTKMQYKKGPSYCLSFLISLVEQTRYLIFKGWPVDWGWCRELQSFIFVFERHNRIVLERPEYGHATYFFSIAGNIAVGWQVRRVVTCMRLCNSRIMLVEDRAIEVGKDISEGEAKVLVDYGWVRNMGIGTMLNYCDRVIHDRRGEWWDWKSKIERMLMDGFNGGTVVGTMSAGCVGVKLGI